MKRYKVTGMSCAACAARVEKAVKEVEGVETCSVSLLTGIMGVSGTQSEQDVFAAVINAGYGISFDDENDDDKSEMKGRKKRLLLSLVFLVPLMYIAMGHNMLRFPLPENSYILFGILQILLSSAVIFINRKTYINGIKGIIKKAPNMDTLVAMGSGVSYLYSAFILCRLIGSSGDLMSLKEIYSGLYFESAAMILVIISVGKMLEAWSKGKTTSALKELMSFRPQTARVEREGGKEEIVPAGDVSPGDIFIVKAGERFPCDGVVLEGNCTADESMMTGESIPSEKLEGDSVLAATISSAGFVRCRALRTGSDMVFSQIIRMVEDAAATKAPAARLADKAAGVFVPLVIAAAAVTAVIWIIAGGETSFVIERAISVLVVSCPCALGLATPVAIMTGNGVGARNGILFKTAESLEMTGLVTVAALDKTGTVTKGKPEVTDIVTRGVSEVEFLRTAYLLEVKSEHPLAAAVVERAECASHDGEAEDFETIPGMGVSGVIDGKRVRAGNYRFCGSDDKDTYFRNISDSFAAEGKTCIFFADDEGIFGAVAAQDSIREDSSDAVRELHELCIKTVMISGDNLRTSEAVGRKAGIGEVHAGLLPGEKAEVIKQLKESGKNESVMMVGDGINDTPSLAASDIGVAIGAGTQAAIGAADVVLMKDTLKDACAAVRLSRAVRRNIRQNLFWAFIYNALLIPLAAGLWYPVLGLKLSPMMCAAAMSLSSFCVVMNALRLNLVKINDDKKDKTDKRHNKEGNNKMEKKITVKGMMCPHCEKRVKDALEKIEGVKEAVPSHENDSVVLDMTADVSIDVIRSTVEEQGYEFVEE